MWTYYHKCMTVIILNGALQNLFVVNSQAETNIPAFLTGDSGGYWGECPSTQVLPAGP